MFHSLHQLLIDLFKTLQKVSSFKYDDDDDNDFSSDTTGSLSPFGRGTPAADKSHSLLKLNPAT